MTEALQFDRTQWYEDRKDEPDYKLPPKQPRRALETAPKEKKNAPRPESQFGPLLRAVWAVADSEDFFEHAEALAKELEMSVEWVYQMALVEFIESHGRDTGGHAERLRQASPYWQTHTYTTEELNALLEADEFSPEMAERYKDLLED